MNDGETAVQTYLAIAPKSTEAAVLRLLIELGVQIAGADEGSLLVLDPAQRDLVFAMTTANGTELIGQRVPLGQGLTGLAAETQEVQIGAPTFGGVQQPAERGQSAPEAVIAAPMLCGEDVVGVITAVSFAAGKRFNKHDAALYMRLATIAGVVVEQRRHISEIAQLARGAAPSAGSAEGRVVQAVTDLTRRHPDRLEMLAQLLESVVAIADRAELG